MVWQVSNYTLPLAVSAFVALGVAVWWGLRRIRRSPPGAGTRRLRRSDLRPIAREAVLDSMQEGVLVLDEQGRVLDLNPAARWLVADPAGEPAGQPAGQPLQRLLQRHAELLELLPARLSAFRARVEIGRRTLDLRSSPLEHQGAAVGRLLVVGDVTAAARAEAELRRAKGAAEAANRAKGQFLATMSHELRSPLTAIIGYADLLATDCPDELDAVQRERAGEILAAGRKLLELVTDVLDYAHLEGGEGAAPCEEVDAVALAREVAEASAERVTGPGRAFRLELPPGPLWLRTDPAKLRRILTHLLANAEKFTARGSVTLALRRDGDGALFEVRDTGIGIPEEQQRGIFEPFTQADGGDARRFGGSGLGLAICRRYAELLGAELDLHSAPGEGSSFTLRLPVGEDVEAQSAGLERVTMA